MNETYFSSTQMYHCMQRYIIFVDEKSDFSKVIQINR